jgi:hypothetical protein
MVVAAAAAAAVATTESDYLLVIWIYAPLCGRYGCNFLLLIMKGSYNSITATTFKAVGYRQTQPISVDIGPRNRFVKPQKQPRY